MKKKKKGGVNLSAKAAHQGTDDDVDPGPGRFADPKRKKRVVRKNGKDLEAKVIAKLKHKSIVAIAAMLAERPLGEVTFLEGQLASARNKQ